MILSHITPFISNQNINSSKIKLRVPSFVIVLWIIISIAAAVIFSVTIICLIIQYLYSNFHKKSLCTVEVISTVIGFMANHDPDSSIYKYAYTPIYEYYYNGQKYQQNIGIYTVHHNENPHKTVVLMINPNNSHKSILALGSYKNKDSSKDGIPKGRRPFGEVRRQSLR